MNPVKIFLALYKKYLQTFQPIRFAKYMGVNFGANLRIYGKIYWSTEPWIITLGENVHLTDNIYFVTHDGGTLLYRKHIKDLEITKPITIGNDVYVGINTVFLPGVKVGNNVVIGACSVVSRDIPDDSVVAGNPARIIKTSEEYLKKLKRESLHLGHLTGKEKNNALKQYYSR